MGYDIVTHYIEHKLLGINGSGSGSGSGSTLRYWAYQDFNLSADAGVTLSSNENATTPIAPTGIVSPTAVLTKTDGTPVGIFLFRKKVDTHSGTTITFNTTVTEANARVWWLQLGVPPAGAIAAPAFVHNTMQVFLDDDYVNQVGDEIINGVKTFGSNPVLPVANPTTAQQSAHKAYVDSQRLFFLSAGRNNTAVTTSYIRRAGNAPTNDSPFVLPFDATIIGIAASCNAAGTWTAELHDGGTLITGATLSIAAAQSAYRSDLAIDVNAGSLIEMYVNGTGINKPAIDAILIRR